MITKGSQKVVNSPKVTTLAIVLVANKTFLNHELFGFGESTKQVARGTSPWVDGQVFNIFSPNIKNLVLAFKHGNSR